MNSALAFRMRWAAAHLLISCVAVSAVVVVVLVAWYPPPLAGLQGLGAILLLLAAVDITLGPLCTLLIASPKKTRAHIARDVAFIGFVQIVALIYGVHTVWAARPAYIVFNKDRFDVVSASELEPEYFGRRTEGRFAVPSIWRPQWVHALPPQSLDERNRILLGAATGGPDLKNFPALYHPWPQDVEAVRARTKPLETLAALSSRHATEISEALAHAGLGQSQVVYIPLVGRNRTGVALLEKDDLSVVTILDIAPDY